MTKKKKRDKWWFEAAKALEENGYDFKKLPPLPLDDAQWQLALQEIERRKDLTPLLEVLAACVPAEVMPHLADLFARYQLKFKPGRQRQIPSYLLSLPEVIIAIGLNQTSALVAQGWDEDDALRQAAKVRLIPYLKLREARLNKRGSARRKKEKSPAKN